MWSWLRKLYSKTTSNPKSEEHHDPSGTIKLGIVVGHTKDASGAEMVKPYCVSEYVYNTEIASLIKQYAESRPDQKVTCEIIFRDGIGISGAYEKAVKLKCDCVVELHFNANDSQTTGTEVLCSYDQKDIDFASYFQKNICKQFNRNGYSRGIKRLSRGDRGALSCYSFDGPNCLVEPAFGDVESESKMLMSMKKDYAISLFMSVYEFYFH